MRRRKWLIAAVIPTCVLIGGILLWKPIRADMGIYIEAGEPIVVFHGGSREPIVMRSTAGNHDMFKKLRTGDKILVFHNGCMMLSYPAQLNVSFCIRLKKGGCLRCAGRGVGIPGGDGIYQGRQFWEESIRQIC